jgi:hypothetical protein
METISRRQSAEGSEQTAAGTPALTPASAIEYRKSEVENRTSTVAAAPGAPAVSYPSQAEPALSEAKGVPVLPAAPRAATVSAPGIENSRFKIQDSPDTGRAGSVPKITNQQSAITNADVALMRRIRARWAGPIAEACRYSSLSDNFIAALIANESGGNECARRFEPHVFAKLKATRDGKATAPHAASGIGGGDLKGADDETLTRLAASYGLTQIMGYHLLDSRFKIQDSRWEIQNPKCDPRRLFDAQFNLQTALRILAEFCQRFNLDPKNEFAEMFCCWNTGQPYGATFDPEYVAKGLARMNIYGELGGKTMNDEL